MVKVETNWSKPKINSDAPPRITLVRSKLAAAAALRCRLSRIWPRCWGHRPVTR